MNLLVTDFDGTLFDENYNENIKLLNELKDTDIVIATGRNYKSLLKDLKIKCKYYICNDGGYILDDKKKVIYKNYIDSEIVSIILSRMKNLKYKEYFLDNINFFSKRNFNNVNKIAIRITNHSNALEDMKFLLKDLNGVYGYISTKWINIISTDSKKENAIKLISKDYDNIYVIGNDGNDYNMIKNYNGFLIGKDNLSFRAVIEKINQKKH